MTVEQLVEKLLEFPLNHRISLSESLQLYPVTVRKSLMITDAVRIGEDREPTARSFL